MRSITNQRCYLERYDEQSFDWLSWKNGTLVDVFHIENRTYSIMANVDVIRKYAIGYCGSDNIPCRPKDNHVAVMFEYECERFWTHFTRREFEICFPEMKN